jgi:predicted Ser/Thr protein kinase
MPETLRCPGCGAGLPADAPEGLCPQCLLKEAMRIGSGPGEGAGTTTPRPSGSVSAPLRPEELAPHFPHLEIVELLGQGGMGVVYKARQVRLDRLVALKILPPELGRDPAFAERFGREARALARLSHPRIVGVYDFGESGGLFYLLMEFVDGVNLRGLLRQGRLEPEEALRIVPQICEALQYAHEDGIVHRDIKPENILLDRRGNVKIADFGLAKLLGTLSPDSALTGSQQVLGTLRYMAPEQMEKPLTVDHRADIYSLGVVFYEMLTGELPMGRFAPPSKKVQVDVRLDEVVLRALEKDPEQRYQHVSELKTEVESLSIPPSRPAVGSGISRDGTEGHELGTAEIWRRLWPLIPIFSAAWFVYATVDGPDRNVPALFVLAGGYGLWTLWRFVGGGRVGPIIRPERGNRHPVGITAKGRSAWLLISLLCVVSAIAIYFIFHLIVFGRNVGTALAVGFGLCMLWLSRWDLISPDRTRSPAGAAAEKWQPWPLLALIAALYGSSFFVPVCPSFESISGTWIQDDLLHQVSPDRTFSSTSSRLTRRQQQDDVLPQPILVRGYEIFIVTLRRGSPLWLANPILWLGCLALMMRGWRWAAFAGLIAMSVSDPSTLTGIPSAVYLLEYGESEHMLSGNIMRKHASNTLLAGFWMWKASMVLLAGGGLYGWWKSRRQGQAKDIKTNSLEFDPPQSGSARYFDGP